MCIGIILLKNLNRDILLFQEPPAAGGNKGSAANGAGGGGGEEASNGKCGKCRLKSGAGSADFQGGTHPSCSRPGEKLREAWSNTIGTLLNDLNRLNFRYFLNY